jgi:hypothetical protein
MASLAASAAAAAAAEVTHLTQRDAAEIDEQLMGPLGFSVDQLMVSQLLFFFARLLRGVVVADRLIVVLPGTRWIERRGSPCGGKGIGHCVLLSS